MQRTFVAVLVGLTLLLPGFSQAVLAEAAPPKPARLVVSTWGFQIALLERNLAERFEREFGIRIVFDFGDNAARLARLIAHKDNPIVDVAAFAPNFAVMAKAEGVLQPLNVANIPNISHIIEWARDPLGNYHGVGYTTSVLKVAYRTDLVDPPVTSWRDFWRPGLAGFITIPDLNTTFGPAVLFSIAKAWGGSLDNLEVGWQKLGELVRTGALLTTYRRSAEAISLFERGEVWMAPIPSFAWPALEATGLPLTWVPVSQNGEGLIASLNTLSVVKGTENTYWAEKFINFWLSQEVQEQMALDLVDAPVNMLVQLPEEIKIRFGHDKDLSKAVFYDPALVVANLPTWLDRWSELIAR